MTKQQLWYYAMYNDVCGMLNNNLAITNTLPDFAGLFTLIKIQLDEIKLEMKKQDAKITGITMNKSFLKNDLIIKAFEVSRKTTAYAVIKGDYILEKEVKCTMSDLKKSDNANLISRCQLIHDLANANIADMSAYGLNSTVLISLQNAIYTFQTAIPEPRVAIEKRKHSTKQIEKAFKTIDENLHKIDVLVEIVRISEPNFYRQYKNARKITRVGVRHIVLRGKAIDKNTGEFLNDVVFKFIAENDDAKHSLGKKGYFMRKTKNKGGFFVKHAPNDYYFVEVSRKDYKPQQLRAAITTGKMNRLTVEMEKE